MTRYRQRLLVSSALVIASLASHAMAATLPTGGTVVAGTGGISQTNPSTLTVTQSSATAIINWNSFSIGQGSAVQFNNGSGATLNRVTGASISQINGLLSATGSVYVVNPNGVIIGKTGVVNTGGTFVASTLDVTNSNFLGGGPLIFTGSSTASVVNLGKVGSLGGNVALIAQSVTNAGTITAANGTIGLASGSLITLVDDTADDGGLIKVEIGEAGDSLTNEGALAAAAVELRAQQGNIYALAGNTSGVIDATGVATKGGQIFLTNPGGATTVTGTLEAQGAGGTPGAIETSGGTLDIGSAIVNAHGGVWLLDPDSLTIDATAAATINAALGADTSVVESTASKGKASSASAGGTGDITVAAALSWSTDATLTLDSYNSIFINAPITVSGAGGVILVTNDTGGKQKKAGKGGDPNVGLYFGAGASLDFTSEASNPTLTINGNAYTLLYNLAQPGSSGPDGGTDDIAGIDNAGDDGYYALANNLVAPTGVTFGSALAGAGGNVFSGVFEGLGHTITGLTINDSNNTNVGLFGTSSGVIRDIGLIGVSVGASRGGGGYYGSYGSSVGGLVGQQLARGSITGAYVTGTVFGGSYTAPYPILGGLVGDNYGAVTGSWSGVSMTSGFVSGGLVGINESTATISQSYATGAISGTNDTGGLAGRNFGGIDQSYATGAVTVFTRPGSGGGLVGYDGGGGAPGGQITNSYATGSVTGVGYIGGIFGYASSDGDPLIANSFATGAVQSSTGEAGGLAGHTEGTITASFWDTQTTGAANAVSDNSGTVSATGLTTAQFQDGASASGLGSAFALSSDLYPYLTSLFPNGVQAISGFAYSDVGANGLADQTVSLIAGGVARGSATTGANGYYYLTLQAGTVTPGGALLAYAPSANSATLGLASGTVSSTGALPGLSLYGQTVTVPTASTTLSGAPNLAGAQALAIAADDAAGDATPTIHASTGLGLITSGASFTVDQAVTGGLSIQTTAANAPITVSSAINADNGSGVAFVATGVLTIAAPVTLGAAGGSVILSAGDLMHIDAPIAVQGAGNVVLTTPADYDFGLGVGGFAGGISYSVGSGEGVPGQTLTINGAAYTLLYSLSDLQSIDSLGDGGNYALAAPITQAAGSPAFAGPLIAATFSGVFEGLGNTISGLTINDASDSAVGLFAVNGGVIRDLGLVGGSVTLNASDSNVGGLVGYQYGSIKNSYSSQTVTVDGSYSSGGGLVGANGGVVDNSYATGAVAATNAGDGVGGLVGFTAGSVTNAYATGAVSGGLNAGGLAGYNNGVVSNSYATGAVGGGDYARVGGLVGYNASAGTITNSFATGAVAGARTNLGGLVGANFGAITSSYATGTVNGGYLAYVGGLVGYNNGSVSDSYATGAVSGGNYAEVGGLVGHNDPGGTITDSFATGAVAGSYGNNLGGLVGANYGAISNAYATGAVNDPSVGDGANIGGLVGSNNGSVSESYATGAVSGGAYAGGLVGYNQRFGAITASFWNTDVSGATYGVGGDRSERQNSYTGETTAQLETLSTFTNAGWNIDDQGGTGATWRIYDGATAPLLRSFLTPLDLTGSSASSVYDAATQTLTLSLPAGTNASLVSAASGLHAGTYQSSSVQLGYDISGGVLTITPEAITVTAAASSKVYDGALIAAATPTVTSGTLYAGDGSLSETYASKDVGSTIALTPTASLTTPGDYAVTYVATNTGVITPATLTASLTGTVSKTYDATNAASLAASNYSLSGAVAGDSVALNDPTSGTYDTANAGTGKTVTVSGLALTNNAAGDYVLGNAAATVSGAVGAITPEAITVTASANSKVYNGTLIAAATPTVTSGTLYAGDGTLAETYASKDVGSTITLTPTATLATPGDYSVTYVSANTGVITPATLTASLTGTVSKTYNDSTAATLTAGNYALAGVVAGDSVSLNDPTSGTYSTTHAGTGETVTVTGLALTNNVAGDYVLGNAGATASAAIGTITPEAITVTASANSKVYNGTTVATAAPRVTSGTLYAGDGSLAETYASKDVGSTITLTPTATLATPGDYSVTYVSANTGVITPATLTASLTGTVSKTYNDSTAATLTAGNYALAGVVAGDSVSLNDPTSGTYSTVHAGTGLTVTVSGLALTNNAAGDYVLGNAGATVSAAIGTITPEAITVTAATNTKIYNGTLVAAATPTVTTGTLYAGDGTLAETYASKDVGSNIALTPTASLTTPGDYSVTYVSTNNGLITPASLTATVVGNVTKVYDSNNVAPLTGANIALAGVVAGDSVSATNPSAGQYATANVGTGILVGATGFSLTGASAKDYTVANAFAFGNVGTITPEAITVTASANTKVYNGTLIAAATPTVTSGTLYSGDGVLSETYASKDVGSAITLTPAIALVDPADYKVTLASANTGVITPASLTATVVGNVTKVYDSNDVAPLTGANIALAGVVAGDSVSATNPSAGEYATVNVGSGILVGATGFSLTGASAKDYTVANAFAFGNVGTITPEPITVSATANSKVYNGTTAAAATPTVTSGKLYAGDGTLSETYASKNVGSAITLTPAVALVDPADYTVTLTPANTGVITPATLNVSLTGTVSKVYNGTTVAPLSAGNYSITGVIGSDQVSVANISGTYATKNVAYAIPVTVSGLTLAGAQAQDYAVTVTSVTASIGTITPDIIQTTPMTFAAGDLQYLQLSAQAPGDYGLSETIGGTSVVIANPPVPKYGSPAIP